MVREGTFADIPRAAAMRQRAWPDTIITAEGMRHHLESAPEREGLELLAFEERNELVGWAVVGRAWWTAESTHGFVELAVDPAHRSRRVATQLAEEAERRLSALGLTTVRSESLDEPAARALAAARGFAEKGSSSVSAVDPRTVEPIPLPDDMTAVPFRDLDDPEQVWALDLEVSRDIPNEEFDSIELDDWVRMFWRSPIIDDDASLAAFVDGELAAVTMIRSTERAGARGTTSPARERRSGDAGSRPRSSRRASPGRQSSERRS